MAKTIVSKVQIYRNSAIVTRKGTMRLSAGKNTAYITGLTETADIDSVRLLTAQGIVTADINFVNAFSVDGEERLKTKELEQKIDAVDFNIKTIKEMMQCRKANANFQNRRDITLEEQEKYLSELPGHLMSYYEKLNALEEEKKHLEDELAKNQASERETVIKAELIAEREGEYPFEIRYSEHAATWSPLYEVRYSSDKEPLSVIMKARFRQNTREDWKDAQVLLYTGNPSVSHDLPKVMKKEIGLYEERPAKMLYMNKTAVPRAALMADGAVAEEACVTEDTAVYDSVMPQAMISNEETMTVFELPGTKDVLRGNDGNVAELSRFEINADYRLLTVPSVNDKVFLSAAVKAEDWPFPASTAKVYVKDAYAGEVFVDPETEENEFELSLGADERVNVSRKESPVKISDVLLKGQKKKQCAYTIKLRNTSNEDLKVLVKDSIPVSTDKQVSVDVQELSKGEKDEETGIVKWNIIAKPGASEELKVSYSIQWPKGKKIRESFRY